MKGGICYLDNAATSFPKPQAVTREVARCLTEYCGNAGRGAHKMSLFAAQKIYECRELLSSLIGAPSPESIAFVPSCTYGLNLIIKGLLRRGDHVILSDMEHNAVWRPIVKLAREGIITYDVFSALSKPNRSEKELLTEIERKIKKNTRLIICNHQSNICSYSLPIQKIGELCKKYHVLFALDVAQSIGHYNIDVQKMNIDFLAAPAHKGLYGVQGAGFVAINSAEILETLIEGGNGVDSLLPDMPDLSPERYEVGTLPLPAIAGLCEGAKFIRSIGIDAVRDHERELFRHLRDGISVIRGSVVYLPELEGNTLSFNLYGHSAEQVCAALDGASICVRGGFHCTALAHRSLNTDSTGTVRVSFGIFNTKSDIDKLLSAVNNFICK